MSMMMEQMTRVAMQQSMEENSRKPGFRATRMLCSHLFCNNCIREWLREANSCPVCRYELATDCEEFEAGRCLANVAEELEDLPLLLLRNLLERHQVPNRMSFSGEEVTEDEERSWALASFAAAGWIDAKTEQKEGGADGVASRKEVKETEADVYFSEEEEFSEYECEGCGSKSVNVMKKAEDRCFKVYCNDCPYVSVADMNKEAPSIRRQREIDEARARKKKEKEQKKLAEKLAIEERRSTHRSNMKQHKLRAMTLKYCLPLRYVVSSDIQGRS
eukprot:g9644.t1